MNTYDVAIVGGGAAGLSAALVLSRARRQVIVLDAGSPRNAPAAHMQGFLSRDGMPPPEFLAVGRAEVESYGADVVQAAVESIDHVGTAQFNARLTNGEEIQARRLLIATGLTDELPNIEGVRERWGKDLLHCPYCHGYEVRNQRIGVLGGTPESVQHAQLIRQWADDVVYFPHTDELTDLEREHLTARAIGIADGTVTRLCLSDDRLSGVEVDGHRVIDRDVVFIRPRMLPNASLIGAVGCATDDNGWVITDSAGLTSVPGVWVAGNARNPRAQVITAAGEGSAAAIAINGDLVLEDVALAVKEYATPALPH